MRWCRLLCAPVDQSITRRIIQSGKSTILAICHAICPPAPIQSNEADPPFRIDPNNSSSRQTATPKPSMAFSGHANLISALLGSGAVILTASEAQAQIVYYPYVGATVAQSGGTITTGGTFQTVLASNPNRHGCLIQNTSSHVMDVYIGTLGSATAANSIQVEPLSATSDGIFRCNHGPFILTDDVNITTSTTSDPYVVMSW